MMKEMIGKLAALSLVVSLLTTGAFADEPQFLKQAPAGFTVKQPVAIYNRANLYEYIDGQAIFYNSYGFTRLEHGIFGKDNGSYVVDVYELATPLSAFGAFRQQREDDAADYSAGVECALIDYLTTFHKDRYYVEITPRSSAGDSDDLGVMKELAAWVDALLPGAKTLPPELAILPAEGLVPRSERYVDESLISYSFMGRGLAAFYREPPEEKDVRVFVGFAPDSVKAEEIFTAFTGKMTNLQKITDGELSGVRGELPYRGISIAYRDGRHLFGAMGITDEATAVKRLSALAGNLKKYDAENR